MFTTLEMWRACWHAIAAHVTSGQTHSVVAYRDGAYTVYAVVQGQDSFGRDTVFVTLAC